MSDIDFNTKLSEWLFNQRELLSNPIAQEAVFDLGEKVRSGASFDGFTPEQLSLLNTMISSMIKMSFIIKNHTHDVDKLINYLS